MLASKQTILQLIDNGVIEDANPSLVHAVSYDLTTDAFFIDATSYAEHTVSAVLNPGDSTFVSSKEVIALPADYACEVRLRNSRLRQGLHLDAPLYFPGHKTRVYYRLTNVSGDQIALSADEGYAQITFEKLDAPTDAPYAGAFADEFSFRGMGSYESRYAAEKHELDQKKADLHAIEKRIYTNVMAIMAIVAAVFTLVNVNAGILGHVTAHQAMAVNLATIGSFSLLAGLLALPLQPKGIYARLVPWALAVVAFGAAFFLM